MKVFGCISYIKIKEFERDKLEVKAKKCTLIGYRLGDMGYCFRDNQNKRVIISQYMVFNESAIYTDDLATRLKRETKPENKDQVEFDEISDDDIVKSISTLYIGESSEISGSSEEEE